MKMDTPGVHWCAEVELEAQIRGLMNIFGVTLNSVHFTQVYRKDHGICCISSYVKENITTYGLSFRTTIFIQDWPT